ncbi:MAG: hypothetical protein JKY65_00215 [Planctomycetes bacterium]|nr:hypothetical protein [Planctomycetota bacterium]
MSTPANLRASTERFQVLLGWVDVGFFATNFRVERFDPQNPQRGWELIATTHSTFSGDARVVGGQTYTYRVIALRDGQVSSPSASVSITIPIRPPPQFHAFLRPTGLSGAFTSTHRVDLSWTDPGLDVGFLVERRIEFQPWVQIATTATNQSSYSDVAALDGVSLSYRVTTLGTLSNSQPSSELSLASSLAQITSLTATALGPDQLRLTWADPSLSEDTFLVQRRLQQVSLPGGILPARYSTTGNHYAYVPGLIDRPAAKDAANSLTFLGAKGHLATLTSLGENFFVMALPAAQRGWIAGNDGADPGTWRYFMGAEAGQTFWTGGLGGSVGSTGYYANWAPGEPNGGFQHYWVHTELDGTWNDRDSPHAGLVQGYFVEFPTQSITGSDWATVGNLPANSTSLTDAVAPGTAYDYLVLVLKSGSGAPVPNLVWLASTPDHPSPTSPMTTSVGSSQVSLSWTDAGAETSYLVQRRLRWDPLPGGGFPSRNPSNGNHYALVAASGISPTGARAAAAGLSFLAQPGHLANLTSQAETDFVVFNLYQFRGWLGGTYRTADSTWRFDDGPEAGTTFWVGGLGGSLGATGYAPWNPNEPNGPYTSASAVHMDNPFGLWNDRSAASSFVPGYLAEFETSAITSGFDFSTVATLPADSTSHMDTTVAASTAYEYRVIAVYSSGNSPPSNVVQATTP